MIVRMEHKGVHLYEAEDHKIDPEIVIGRSSLCAWRVPAEEKDVSSRHARLFRKGDAVWIEDLGSSNGTFYRGKAIKKRKLRNGDHLSVGACLISADATHASGPVQATPEIVLLSGKGRGQPRPVRGPLFTVGSDPASSLVLLDNLVSRHHAEIQVKEDGSCWLRELGSKNGTSVNDAPLRQGQERLLKNGDRISFAHLETRFSDGTTRRSNARVWLRLAIVGATLLIGGGLYGGYQTIKPSAVTYIDRTRASAEAENFAAARKELDQAMRARKAAAHQLEIEDLSRLLTLWDSTVQTWASARQALAEGDWVLASRDLGTLYATKTEAWTWSPGATDQKNDALRAKTMLDTLLRATGLLRGEDAAAPALEKELANLRQVLAANADQLPDYLARTRTDLTDIQGKMELYLAESAGLEKALSSLTAWPPPAAAVAAVLEETQRTSRGILKRRSELMAEPVKALAASVERLNASMALAREMKFEEAAAVDLQLPSTSSCALDSRVSQARANLESTFERMKLQMNQLRYLFRELNKMAPESGERVPAQILAWHDKDIMQQVFACDSLDQPLPRRSRKDPSGQYDRYLGIEEFYEYLMAITLRQQWTERNDLPFHTLLFQAESIVKAVDTIDAFFARQDWAVQLTPVNTTYDRSAISSASGDGAPASSAPRQDTLWLLQGPLEQRVTQLRKILAERETIVNRMLTIATQTQGRTAIIAAGIAHRLAANRNALKIGEESLDHFIARTLQDNRASLRDLGQSFDLAHPTRQIELRNEILDRGLPGDPIVKRMWSALGTQATP